jgi:hypothetical protein
MWKPCFVFYQGRNKDPNGRPELQGPGICYVRRNNVVPLHSFLPHWLAHDDLPIGHGVDLETRDGAGLGSLETYTYGHPYDVGF